jgi:uncharacterized repeat protein (TIGR03806 family)
MRYIWIFSISFGIGGILDYAKPKLSDYHFFNEPIKNQIPKSNVFPYQIPTPLFTDYAHKLRFIVLPEGQQMSYVDPEQFNYPIGSILIKTFYYPIDFREPNKNLQIIETRLLINTEEGWFGYPYIWNNEQTDAFLEIAGDRKTVSWIDLNGKSQKANYLVPNVNMCKGCHVSDNNFLPIGPKPRLLNSNFKAKEKQPYHQLEKMTQLKLVKNLPEIDSIPITANWEDSDFSLNKRARAYLDINCGHCHNSKGPAMTSGLYLDYFENDLHKIGLHKTPVASGRGSGNLKYNIVPGKPKESILIYRMESMDSGIMMPELGRKLVHKEGVKLIKDWIQSMD